MFDRLLEIPGIDSGVVYLLRDEFMTDAAAPLTSPRTCEPGPGTLTLTQTDGQLSISGGKLTYPSQATPVWGDQGFYAEKRGGGSFARVAGRAFIFTLKQPTTANPLLLSWHTTTALGAAGDVNSVLEILFEAGTFRVLDGSTLISTPYTWSASTDEIFALVLRGTGGLIFKKISGTWTLLWVGTVANTSNLYPVFKNHQGAGTLDGLKVRDLPVPFTTDNGLCTFNVTADTQSIGSELVTNGDFSAWASNDPSSWTVNSEIVNQTVSESASDGSAGNGSARFVKTTGNSSVPSVTQNLGATGNIYEIGFNLTANAGGSTLFLDNATGDFTVNPVTVGMKRTIQRFTSAARIRIGAFSTANADFVIDDVTTKRITLATAQVAAADSVFHLEYTLPASPVAGQTIYLFYRTSAVGEELLNGWAAYIRRNDVNTNWDIRLDSIVAGVATNRINFTGIGATDAMCIITQGNNHDFYSRFTTTWTKRGSTISNATFATATGCNYAYSAGFTFGAFRAWARTAATYGELDKA